MSNNIQGRGLAKKHNVTVCANPAATTRDILDHVKPTLQKIPDVVIVHCGTNDLTSQEKTIENLQELIRMAKKNHQTLTLFCQALLPGGTSQDCNKKSTN